MNLGTCTEKMLPYVVSPMPTLAHSNIYEKAEAPPEKWQLMLYRVPQLENHDKITDLTWQGVK